MNSNDELAAYIESLPLNMDDAALSAALATKLCGSLHTKPKTVAVKLAERLRQAPFKPKLGVIKLDIFEQPQRAVLSVSVKQLQELYELGVYRGSTEAVKPSQMKCVIECGVIDYGTPDGMGEA